MTTSGAQAPRQPTQLGRLAGMQGRYIDDRLGASGFTRRFLNKVFPSHWSFMIGEIALYSFIILLLTGTFLTLFFDPTQREVIYNGSYVPLKGVPMSEAYASTLKISFDVRAGMLIRQIHHWAALLFVSAIVVHLCRVFFTGAFRKPRELNWHIGVGLLVLGVLEGFAGYSLPDDLLSGTGIRIAYSVAQSIPVIGTWAGYLLFGGEFPGEIIGRLYVIHILLVPGIILALITAHMMIMWHQKHTQFPGPGRTETNVVGSRMFPTFAAKSGGFFMIVFGMLALLGAVAQINPVWLYGPYDPSQVSAGSQPDWYIGFLEGSLRMFPNWEFRGLGYDIPLQVLIPGVVLPGIMFTLLALYPELEARITRDHGYHNLLDRPRDKPIRTGLGVMALTFYTILWIMGGNDVIANIFHISLNFTTWAGRVLIFAAPPIAFALTRRICVALATHEREEEEHGLETGFIQRLPTGEYVERHAPLPEQVPVLTPVEPEHEAGRSLHGHEGGGVRKAGRALGGFFTRSEDEERASSLEQPGR